MTQIIVITGASSGFGALAAHALAKSGHTVYAGMRDTAGRNAPQVEALQANAAQTGMDLRAVELDVQSELSVEAAIATILREGRRLDTVVHNAGHMVFGPAEAFTPEQYAALYDVNVLGTQRVNRVALPILRRQSRGLVVWVSSTSTRGGTPPWLAPYFAAKAAMDSLAVIPAFGRSDSVLKSLRRRDSFLTDWIDSGGGRWARRSVYGRISERMSCVGSRPR